MPKFVVAYPEVKYDNLPEKVAASSISNIKDRIRQYSDTQWKICFYSVDKFDKSTVLSMVEDFDERFHPYEEVTLSINNVGRFRKV